MRCKLNGEAIRCYREARGLTASYVARAVGKTNTAVLAWESGTSKSTDEITVEVLARVLHVTPYDIAPNYIPPLDPSLGRIYYDQGAVRRLRAEHGLSVRDVARRSGLARATVSHLENREKASATAAQVYALARGLGVKPGELSQVLEAPPGYGERELYDSYGRPLTYDPRPFLEDERPPEIS